MRVGKEGRKGWFLGSAHSLWGCSEESARGREAKKLFELSAEEAEAEPMRQSYVYVAKSNIGRL